MQARQRTGRTEIVGLALLAAILGAAGSSSAGYDERGWGWLIDRLAADGLPRARVREVFLDPRVDPFDGLRFSLWPRESHAMYRGHLSAASIARARRCRDEHAGSLRAAEAEHGVSAEVVAAIIHVESACGRNTGSRPILPALARLAMAGEPGNLAENIEFHTAGLDGAERDVVEARTRARAARLDETFYPEVRATFEVARRLGVSPLALRGSGAGAFGIPQFLPGSYLRHGVDGDGDGAVSLYDHADAIHSAARYLAAHGWRPGLSRGERRQVVWAYNHSDAYIDTVLALADRLGDPSEREPVASAPPRAGGRTARVAAPRRHAARTATAARRTASAKTRSATTRSAKTSPTKARTASSRSAAAARSRAPASARATAPAKVASRKSVSRGTPAANAKRAGG